VTPVAAAVVVLVSVAVLAGVLRALSDIATPAAVAVAGGLTGALALHLAARGTGPASGLAVGLLALPAGAGIGVGIAWAVLVVVEGAFPVEEEALLSVGWLLALGHAGVVVGAAVAALGLGLLARPPGNDDPAEWDRLVLWAGLAPTAGLAAFWLVSTTGTTADEAVVAPLSAAAGPFLAPLAALVPGPAGVPVLLAVIAVPVAAVLTRLEPGLSVGPVTLDRQAAGALVGGLLTTVGVVAVAGDIYTRAVTELLRRLPEDIEGDIEEQLASTAASVGESTLVLGAAVLLVGVVSVLVLTVRLACRAGLVSTEAAGSSLAAVGLFLVTVFGATVGVSRLLVVAGIVASLLVWDAGRFGVGLAREAGPGARRVELAHLGGAALVGLCAGVAALLVAGRVTAGGASAVDLLALSSVVVGLLALVLSLR